MGSHKEYQIIVHASTRVQLPQAGGVTRYLWTYAGFPRQQPVFKRWWNQRDAGGLCSNAKSV